MCKTDTRASFLKSNGMDISRKMVIILSIFTTVRAQTTSNQGDMNPLHPSLAVVLVVLSIVFGITFIIVAYAKFCHRHAQYPVNQLIQDPPGVVRSMSRFSGVDRTIIESLPFFRFSSLKGSKEGLECVVCLSRFEDCEILRLLPKCRHAFHMKCIDKWLEKHSSCPLCRYKFDVEDLKYFTCTNSFRNLQQTNHSSEEQQNLEFYIQREENPPLQENSSRFNVATTFQKLPRSKGEEPLIRKLEADRNVGRFQHKIIISDVLQKSRWSEVNSSDLMSLSSDMLNAFSSKRFSPAGTSRDSLNRETLSKEQMLKIKDDIERKRIYESMMISTRTENIVSDGHPGSSTLCAGNVEHCGVSRLLDSDQRRSMSEITNIPRFAEFGVKNSSVNGASTHGNIEMNDKIKRLWLPIARRTIQRFASQEKNLLDTHNLGPDHV